MNRKRLFIAIDLSKELQNKIKPILKQLNDFGIKTISPNRLHITLKFLGYVDEDEIPNISKSIERVVKKQKPFLIKIKGISAFPNKSFPRVIFLKIESKELLELMHYFESIFSCYHKDKNEKTAHITIARIKEHNKKIKNIFKSEFYAEEFVKEIKLIESKLKEGKYYCLSTFYFFR